MINFAPFVFNILKQQTIYSLTVILHVKCEIHVMNGLALKGFTIVSYENTFQQHDMLKGNSVQNKKGGRQYGKLAVVWNLYGCIGTR